MLRMFLGLVAVPAVFRPAMPKVAMYIVVAVLAHLGASSFALADERTLNVGCYFSGENMVSLDIALIQKKKLSSDKVLDLMVSGVDLEVHSEVGGFWIQFSKAQPLSPKKPMPDGFWCKERHLASVSLSISGAGVVIFQYHHANLLNKPR